MRYIEVAGVKVSVIGLGTWQFGSRDWGYGISYAQKDAPAIATAGLDMGINLIDTAEAYSRGESERILSKVVVPRRKEVFLATKLFPILPVNPIVAWRAHASAARLETDYIDLYQIHWPNPAVPISQTMKALRELQQSGLIRHIGVSNFQLSSWQRAEKALGGVVLSNQVRYNLVSRSPEKELIPWAQANDRLIIAYSPLAQGLLSARYSSSNRPGALRAVSSLFLPENLDKAKPLFEALDDVASSHDATPAQIALAWVISHKNVVAIPGASSIEQLEANVAAADIVLTPDEIVHLNEMSAAFTPSKGLVDIAHIVVNLPRTAFEWVVNK
ncbi:MAG: aldo/keto reductase [Actinobacteria bacterium]|nr:aldo/keto reductase [Actinomycetota bacterium]MCL6105249.1 aldo/keto reductase [Actinomycetota bacterium]